MKWAGLPRRGGFSGARRIVRAKQDQDTIRSTTVIKYIWPNDIGPGCVCSILHSVLFLYVH